MAGSAQPPSIEAFYTKAKEAYSAGDYEAYFEGMLKAHELHPYHQVILYHCGVGAALTGRSSDAYKYLRQAVMIDARLKLKDNPDLASLQGQPAFDTLLKLQQEMLQPIIHSDTAFVIPDRTLHLECVAANSKDGSFFMGSIHRRKIIRRDIKGSVSDFTSDGAFDLGGVFGLKVDTRRQVLWACSSPVPEMEDYDSTLQSALYKFDIKSGSLLGRYTPDYPATHFVFGDMTLNSNGEPFVSDGQNNVVFKIDEKNNKLVPYYTSKEFWNIQGITFSNDDRYLFIADYIKGIFRLDTKTHELILLTCGVDASMKGIDGLTYYHHHLVAIQNGVHPLRVTRYALNPNEDVIVSMTILDRAHPAFHEPTIGDCAGSEFYYVANSQWNGYTEDFRLKNESDLQDIVILKANLEKLN